MVQVHQYVDQQQLNSFWRQVMQLEIKENMLFPCLDYTWLKEIGGRLLEWELVGRRLFTYDFFFQRESTRMAKAQLPLLQKCNVEDLFADILSEQGETNISVYFHNICSLSDD